MAEIDIASSLNSTLWAVCALIGLPILYLLFLIARGRTGLRTIEQTHLKDPEKNDHEDVAIDRAPRRLRAMVAQYRSEFEQCGFSEFLTGRRMRLKAGRADTHYHLLVSSDRSTLAECTHVRVARILAIWPRPLPLSSVIGPTSCTLALETLFSNDHTLITTSNPAIKNLKMPSVHVNFVSSSDSFSALWQSHNREQVLLKEKLKTEAVPMNDRESYFNKSLIQRGQIAADQKRRMEELRDESMADIWDNKPK